MTPRWRDRLDPLAGPAPAWPAPIDRLADRWAASGARTRLAAAVALAATTAIVTGLGSEPTVVTVTARVDLPAGSALHDGLLTTAELPRSLVPPDAETDVSSVSGQVLRHPIAAGHPILGRALVTGLDAALAPGRVAVALPAELVPELAPGQRLDVVGADTNGVPQVLAADAVVLRVDVDGVWVEVDRSASAALGHAIAWGGLTVAVLPPSG